MLGRYVAIGLCAGLLAVTPIYAQQDASRPRYNLSECIALAIKNNLDYKKQELQHEQSKLRVESSRSAYLPTVQGSLSQGWDFGRSVDKTGVMSDRSSMSTSASLGASVVLFSGFSRLHDLRSAKLQVEASLYGLSQARQDMGIQVTQLYFALLHSHGVYLSAQRQYERSHEQALYARSMQKAGKWSEDKALDAEATEAQASLNLVQAENNEAMARLDLEQAMNVKGFDIVDMATSEALQGAKDNLLNGEEYLERAMAIRPSLRANQLNQAAAEEQIKSYKAAYMPQLSLSLGYSNSYYKVLGSSYADYNQSFREQIAQNGRSYIGLSLSVPIFDAFRTRTQIRGAKLSLNTLKIEQLSLKQQLQKEIETAVTGLRLAERKVQATEGSLRATKAAFNLAESAWKLGRTTSNELSEAANKHFAAEIELLNAQYDCLLRSQLLKWYLEK